ncbi:hypothetical protein VTJ04DRAFT_5085 [Mycothermus thermophilus]|uniref:uncharacterized protein n=1 Tax=Humicola insolens TaxID=85995 RepID=UPI0037446800
MCDNDSTTPFCSPQSGTRVQTGDTLEITWNPLFFSPSSPQPADEIFIQADFYLPSSQPSPPQLAGFTSTALDPSAGAFRWPILDAYIPGNSTSATALLSIAAPNPTTSTNGSFVRIGNGAHRFPGPSVEIIRAADAGPGASNAADQTPLLNGNGNTPQQGQGQQQPSSETQSSTTTGTAPPTSQGPLNPLAIALPISLGVFTALLMVAYIMLKRNRPDLLAKLSPKKWGVGGGGYGERQSRRQRMRKVGGRNVEIKVVKTDVEGLRANAARMVGMGTMPGMGGGQGWSGYAGGRV